MLIHGKERGFKLTIGASAKIAELCPGGDMAKLGDVLKVNDNMSKSLVTMAKIFSALNEGFEMAKKFEIDGYEPDVLSVDEILSLSPSELAELQEKALDAFGADSATTVEVAPAKKTKAVAE